jgi:hypothetical protein
MIFGVSGGVTLKVTWTLIWTVSGCFPAMIFGVSGCVTLKVTWTLI